MTRHQITTTNLQEYLGKEVIVVDNETMSERKIILQGWIEGKIAGSDKSKKVMVHYYPPVKMFIEA